MNTRRSGTIHPADLAALLEIKETALFLALTMSLPLFIHLIPCGGSVPLGARLLPIFYAPFIAVFFFKPHVGMISGLLAPWANLLLTGRPDPVTALALSCELALFAVFSKMIMAASGRLPIAAPAAYIASVFITGAVLGLFPSFSAGVPGTEAFVRAIAISWPGILMLLLVNMAAVLYKHRKNED